jgi:DegV family protein with EDD domain
MTVRVVTDSACDLPQELIDEHEIVVVPLSIRFGAEELVDREELSTAQFWQRLRESDVLPETAAPSAGAFEKAFRDLIGQDASGIVCINLSSRLSATMQAAKLAADAVGPECPVQVVDSLTCSMGVGELCLAAARQAAGGAELDVIVADVTARRDRTRLYGALDTLEFLKKGGRVGNARALLGSMLSIKPVVEVRDGVVGRGEPRGARAARVRLGARRRARLPRALHAGTPARPHAGRPDAGRDGRRRRDPAHDRAPARRSDGRARLLGRLLRAREADRRDVAGELRRRVVGRVVGEEPQPLPAGGRGAPRAAVSGGVGRRR